MREYILSQDNHTCQHCQGKSKDKVLCVHHLESSKTGGNATHNLITLCETCIAGNLHATRSDVYLYQKQIRKHNRQIHKANAIKGGIRKLNQAPYIVKGFRLFDKVKVPFIN